MNEESFWTKVEKTENCWIWKAARDHKGYGWLRYDGKLDRAHRISYRINIGEIPKGLCILHRCDNPPCVRPDHLFLGTRLDNIIDMVVKERSVHRFGEKNPRAIITKDIADKIRKKYFSSRISQLALAKEFKISQQTVSLIIRKERWT